MADPVGLIVPIDVAAYCVGSIDASEQTVQFAGATTHYTNQTGRYPAFIGVNVTRDADQPPLWKMEEGVHLHWAAPDGLTHATQAQAGADLAFPALPNRWLVTRLLIADGKASGKAWIIESDTLSEAPPNGKNAPSLPVQDQEQNFRYVGAWQIFDGTWVEPDIPVDQTIKALFGSEIHAVASGDIAFAAFYPNARNVLGFYDDVADVAVTGSEAANLTYVVTGWYSNPANDPLSDVTTPEQLESRYGWTYTPGTAAMPAESLYSGLVQDVSWNPETRYITDSSEPVELDVAVGNNPAETMAAYFRGLDHPSLPIFEQLFTMFEMGLLGTFVQPRPGQLAELAETLHERQFNAIDAGTIYTIVPASPPNSASLDDQNVAPNLPLPLAGALNLLNAYRQDYDLAVAELRQYRWRMFADWYRLFQVDPASQTAAFNTLTTHAALSVPMQQNVTDAHGKYAAQLEAVTVMLGEALLLKPVPAPRYWTPNEPVVLVAGQNLEPARRFGGDGRFDSDGALVCRLTTGVVTSVQMKAAGPLTLTAAQFSGAVPQGVVTIPHGSDCASLVEEACLLNTAIAAALSGSSDSALIDALNQWLDATRQPGNLYQEFTGTLPSPVAVQWWQSPNPWFPLFLLWEAYFHPLQSTTSEGALQNYAPEVFTANYSVDPDQGGQIAYTPDGGSGSIDVDPSRIDFDPDSPQSGTVRYAGTAVLSPAAADNLETLLTRYLTPPVQDATLQSILGQLRGTNVLLQALNGFGAALLMQAQTLQLNIDVAPDQPMPFRLATSQVQDIIGDLTNIPALAPDLFGSFNPLRAGYAQLQLRIMDVFGQKRPVQVRNLYLADSVTTLYKEQVEPGIIALQPRLAQPSRLLLRWLSAGTAEYDEMNAHPATSPVCGWLLTNHLSGGFFFFDQLGKPLGSMTVKGDDSGIDWQATPGDDSTINEDLAAVMQSVNPHLADLAAALFTSVDFFQKFWTAVDTASTFITPPSPNSNAGTAALIGQPVALVQVSLLLQLRGLGATNLSFATFDAAGADFADTDNGLGAVRFPVILGDFEAIDDGLVGYFKQQSSGAYEFSTFYSEAAAASGTSGVVQPTQSTLLLTPVSTTPGQPPSISQGQQKVLLLMDPRAAIHATTGILPTQSIEIPPDQYADVLADLEMTFLATPVLKPSGGLSIPLPNEPGYVWSWIEERRNAQGTSEWLVTPDIRAPVAGAIWQYGPQSITEGWLRLNPAVLKFTLLNAAGAPIVTAGAANDLTLDIRNLRRSAITFTPGVLTNEGAPPQGSVFYIHFGALVDSTNVAAVQLSAAGWTFQTITDAQYGTYWAATPAAGNPVTLAPGANQQISVSQLQAAQTGTQGQVYFDYYDIEGDADGVDVVVMAIRSD